ncbi:hypothetical protein [Burkholderia plantarii]|uniref:hypothetical protein n=1 Tax=Burkholderia plantarii TaxID=41899 RepID=UPI00114C85DF|nr:hypothetical protein [Burkholderia plantarii]
MIDEYGLAIPEGEEPETNVAHDAKEARTARMCGSGVGHQLKETKQESTQAGNPAQSLTDREILDIWREHSYAGFFDTAVDFGRACIAAAAKKKRPSAWLYTQHRPDGRKIVRADTFMNPFDPAGENCPEECYVTSEPLYTK